MKNIFLLLLLLAGFHASHAQMNKKLAKDTIIWKKDSLLVKENFQAKHPVVKAPAYTTSSIYFYSDDKSRNLLYHVEALFIKSKSYMKDSSLYALNHEQLHFDICEVNARRLRQMIKEKDFTKVKNAVSEIQKMANKAMKDFRSEETEYDRDTQHGINSAKQHLWDEKVAKELSDLEKYSATEIDIANN